MLSHCCRRSPSLDIIASAWLDSDLDLAGRGTINLSKSFIAKCYNKVKQKANMHIVARAKTYLSAKISVTQIYIESRPVENDILVPSYIVGKTLPHIVLKFILSLNSELLYLSIRHLKLRKLLHWLLAGGNLIHTEWCALIGPDCPDTVH